VCDPKEKVLARVRCGSSRLDSRALGLKMPATKKPTATATAAGGGDEDDDDHDEGLAMASAMGYGLRYAGGAEDGRTEEVRGVREDVN
jgi:hypothetical protein